MSIFYLIFILLTAYYSYRYDGIEEYDSHKQHRLWLMCFYLICLAGFSYGLGGDKFTYMEEFEEYPNDFSEIKDYIFLKVILRSEIPLWTIINLCCKVFFNSFYWVQFLESAAINIVVCYLVSKLTHRYFLFLLIYFFSLQYFIFNTEVMREGFAMSSVLMGVYGWMNNKKWLYYLSIPIGILFHVSAAIVLLFPLAKFKVTLKTLGYACIIAFGLWFISDVMLKVLTTVALGGIGSFVSKVLLYSMQASTIFGFARAILTFLIIPFVIMYTSIVTEESEERRQMKEKITAFVIILGTLASSFAGFVRLYNYTQIFYLITFADFLYTLFRIKKHLMVRLGALAGATLIIIISYAGYYETTGAYFYEFYYPYTCILDETDDVMVRKLTHIESTSIKVEDNNTRDID